MTNKNKFFYSGIVVVFIVFGYVGNQWFQQPKIITSAVVEKVESIVSSDETIIINNGAPINTPINSKFIDAKTKYKVYINCKDKMYVLIEIPSQILIIHPQKYLSQRRDNKKYQIFIASKETGETEVIEQHYKPVLCRFL